MPYKFELGYNAPEPNKTVDSEIVPNAIEENPMSITWGVSGEFSISESLLRSWQEHSGLLDCASYYQIIAKPLTHISVVPC